MSELDFSVIIPASGFNDYLQENLNSLEKQKKVSFEVIIVFDNQASGENISHYKFEKTILVSNGGPSKKRNLAAGISRGKWLAFIDDDAYPKGDWFKVAKKYLIKDEVAAIGGPQLTPPKDSFWQKVSGAMFLSPLSGLAAIRFWPGKKIVEIRDWPTVNFFIKKKDFQAVGGFDDEFWPGEDTKLCLDVIKNLKRKMLYIPELVVFHHRRSGLKKHLRQTGSYGLHRGFFAKRFPETSARFSDLYFVPSLWVLYLILGLATLLLAEPIFWEIYLSGICIYFLAVLFSAFVVWRRTKNLLVSLVSSCYLVMFHFWYGSRFIQGYVFTKDLKSKLGR